MPRRRGGADGRRPRRRPRRRRLGGPPGRASSPGPLFTLMKALDAIHLARELSKRGVPAVPVFWALTDDHDLQEIARTARPDARGPAGARARGRGPPEPPARRPAADSGGDPRHRRGLPPGRAGRGRRRGSSKRSRARSAPGTPYGEAFIETLLDLVDPDPLLVLDPLDDAAARRRRPSSSSRRPRSGATLARDARATRKRRFAARASPSPRRVPEAFSFFTIDREGRRRIEDLPRPSRASRRARPGPRPTS